MSVDSDVAKVQAILRETLGDMPDEPLTNKEAQL